jgi:Zn-dependent protease
LPARYSPLRLDSVAFKAVDFAIQLAVLLFAISFHESAHALAAYRCGDPTARDLGRISLNPIRHIDPIGTILVPLLLYFTHAPLFGWAKPTPVRLEQTRNPRAADVIVSVAGPTSNLLLSGVGLLGLFAIRVLAPGSAGDLIDALRGQRFAEGAAAPLAYLAFQFSYVNFLLGIFNLIPIPPLDGSWVLASLLGDPVRRFFREFGRFGFLLLILLSSTRVFGRILAPFLRLFYGVVSRILFAGQG